MVLDRVVVGRFEAETPLTCNKNVSTCVYFWPFERTFAPFLADLVVFFVFFGAALRCSTG